MNATAVAVSIAFGVALGSFASLQPQAQVLSNEAANQSEVSVPLTIGGQQLRIGMSRDEALQRLGECCTVTGPADGSFIVSKSQPKNVIGAIFFRDGRVSELRRDEHSTIDEDAALVVVKMFRMLDEMARTAGRAATVRTNTVEGSNASGREIHVEFSNGRILRISHASLDAGGAQVSLYEER